MADERADAARRGARPAGGEPRGKPQGEPGEKPQEEPRGEERGEERSEPREKSPSARRSPGAGLPGAGGGAGGAGGGDCGRSARSAADQGARAAGAGGAETRSPDARGTGAQERQGGGGQRGGGQGAENTPARPVPFRGGGFRPRRVAWVGPVVFVALIGLVEWGTRAGWISALTLPRPSDVAATLWEMAASGRLWLHLAPSLMRLLMGAVIGVSAGVAVGLAIGLFTYARAALVPLVAALFPIPKIALLPLFVIWFGIDEASKYALIAFGTFTPTVVATYGAVDNVERTLIRMGQSFGLPWGSIVRKIVLPGAMPGILSGLRVSLAIAVILLVAAEMLGAEYGIGAFILEAGSLYDLERLFAGVVILSALGVAISFLIGVAERRLLNWRS